ncbi:Membrane magnesium transporter 1 [Actinomortierella ambigua]|nr:Membrane magnesium transporter 1 [Actinomortierella ambigua]
MDRNDDYDVHSIPTVQERRRQLEAFQAERALRKSMRASVRGINNVSRFLLTSQQSEAPLRRVPVSASIPISSNLTPSIRPPTSGLSDTVVATIPALDDTATQYTPQQQMQQQEEPLKRLGTGRSEGTTGDRVIHRHASPSVAASSVPRHLLGQSSRQGSLTSLKPALAKSRGILKERPYSVSRDTVRVVGSSKPNASDLLAQPPSLSNQHTRQPFFTSSPADRNAVQESYLKGHDGGGSTGLTLEELYFRQVQVMQWNLVLSRASIQFESVQSTAKELIDQQEKKLEAVSRQHEELLTRFAMERDLSTLEATFGPVRDRLSQVSNELQSIKATLVQSMSVAAKDPKAATSTADRQSPSKAKVVIERERLADLEKATIDCQRVAKDAMLQSAAGSEVIAIELLVSVALCGLGIVLVADNFKEILMETEMAKQSIESLDARPSFYVFNHRGRAVFRNVFKN